MDAFPGKETFCMIHMFNSKTIYLGYDLKYFNEVRDYLDQNKIPYKYKIRNRLGQWSGNGTLRGRTGSIGTPSHQMYEYEILVRREDYPNIHLP